jgi:predicted O-methyltransferase YrrM
MWNIQIAHHATRINAMPSETRLGRNIKEGYERSCGIQFGNISSLCETDKVFMRAYGLAKGRTLVAPQNFCNFYMLIRFFLPRLPFGHIAEFGAYRGGSAIFFAAVAQEFDRDMKVFAFDTFAGMPATDARRDAHKAGDFGDASYDDVRRYVDQVGLKNLELVRGQFSETIANALPATGSLRMVHIDCDTYDSVVAAYDGSKPYMVSGGYIAFDDPLTSSCIGAFEAVEEVVIRRDRLHAEQAYPHLVYRAPLKGGRADCLAG